MAIRAPHVAGTFYPQNAGELRQFIQQHLSVTSHALKAKALVLPHAGYIYSGPTALKVISHVSIPDTLLLIGPNHYGVGSDFALFGEGEWETPLGAVKMDERLAKKILASSPDIIDEPLTHSAEHSLEVIVPMLQMQNPRCKIVPLIVGTLDAHRSRLVAEDIAKALLPPREDFLIVISTDMSHYEDDEVTRRKDHYALEAITHLDGEGLLEAARKYRITMCGLMPVYMLLSMKDALGIKKATLVEYATSADATGDKSRVVGYAGFIFE